MSVIQKIRDKYAAVVIAVIALSLVGFILMDAFVGRSRGAGGNTTIGKVNGEKIERNDFEKRLTMQESMYASQGAKRDQLIGSVWEQSVDEIVMNQEYEKLGLQLTSKELNDVLFGANPPQWLKSEFTDAATGTFKVNEAKQYFAQMKKQKNNPNLDMFNEAYIKPTISQSLRDKYLALLNQSVYVPKWMAEKSLADQNALGGFSYVSVPYTSISDSAIKVSDDDIKAYVDKHKLEFKQEEEVRSISYVSFNAFPSVEDTATVFNQINGLKNDFGAATEPQGYLSRVSTETPYLDAYILGSKIMVPNADSILKLGNGQVFGPYLDGKNYTVAKMIDRRSIPDSAKVRHILIKTAEKGQPTLSDSIAKARIDSIEGAIRGGADFNVMVLQFSDDQGSKATAGEYTFPSTQFPNISKEFAETAFYGNPGDKKVVKVEMPNIAVTII